MPMAPRPSSPTISYRPASVSVLTPFPALEKDRSCAGTKRPHPQRHRAPHRLLSKPKRHPVPGEANSTGNNRTHGRLSNITSEGGQVNAIEVQCFSVETLGSRLAGIAGGAGNLHQRIRLRRGRGGDRLEGLGGAPVVNHGDLLDTGDGAVGRAEFFCRILAAPIGGGVFLERYARVPALLRTPVHQPVLADVEVTRAGAAPPVIFLSAGDVVLETVEQRIGPRSKRHDL